MPSVRPIFDDLRVSSPELLTVLPGDGRDDEAWHDHEQKPVDDLHRPRRLDFEHLSGLVGAAGCVARCGDGPLRPARAPIEALAPSCILSSAGAVCGGRLDFRSRCRWSGAASLVFPRFLAAAFGGPAIPRSTDSASGSTGCLGTTLRRRFR